jgi:23S rRNA (adenine2503-C2)-methyltransferase
MLENDIRNYTRIELQDIFKNQVGKEKYRSEQIFRWLYEKTVDDFFLMTDLNKNFRTYLNDNYIIGSLKKESTIKSVDGTIKYLFKTADGYYIESVYIPFEGRQTVCISSQIGCKMGCKFCATAKIKFIRNLSLSEIISQIIFIQQDIIILKKRITNIVFMGMGEPLLNIENVLKASEIFTDVKAFKMANSRITISTCGIVPIIPALSKFKYKLAISLNSADDNTRNLIMPVNKKYPLKILKDSIIEYYKNAGKNFVSFEYIMFKDLNTSNEAIDNLIKYVKSIGWLTKVNLIPFNYGGSKNFQPLDDDGVDRIFRRLNNAGVLTTVRRSKGSDIAAACGQLAGNQ